jgi:Spy/CpxP family protein refolding chaperone
MKKLNTTRMFALSTMMFAVLAVPLAFGQSKSTASGTEAKSGTSMTTPQARAWRNESPYRASMRMEWKKLNLTASQKDQIKKIRTSDRPEIRGLMKQLWSKREELRATFDNGTFSESMASQKFAEMAPIQAKLMEERYKEHNEIMAVLSPQQRTELQQFQKEAWQNGPKGS